MLAKRIIPCLDVTAGRVVKGVNFVNLRDAGDPVELADRYNQQGADELVFLDITASSDAAYRDLIGHFVAFYREQLLNEHWGESINMSPKNELEISMAFEPGGPSMPRKLAALM